MRHALISIALSCAGQAAFAGQVTEVKDPIQCKSVDMPVALPCALILAGYNRFKSQHAIKTCGVTCRHDACLNKPCPVKL